MGWHDIIKFNKEHLGEFVNNKSFWERFNELQYLFDVMEDDERDYERVKYITINEFLLKNRIDKAIEYIEKESAFLNDDEYEVFNKKKILEILKGKSE